MVYYRLCVPQSHKLTHLKVVYNDIVGLMLLLLSRLYIDTPHNAVACTAYYWLSTAVLDRDFNVMIYVIRTKCKHVGPLFHFNFMLFNDTMSRLYLSLIYI